MTEEGNSGSRFYGRFSLGQRYLHATLFTSFLGLGWTGMTLRFSSAVWAERFARVVGGFGAILFFHKFFAVLLTGTFLIHVGDIVYRAGIKRQRSLLWGPNSLLPQPKDFKDLSDHVRWFLWMGPRPRFDRFAYWEKFDYWAVFWGMAIIGLSGYAMWFAPFFARIVPGSWLNAALLLHGEEALLAVWFIFTIHFFNTHLRPGSFPMDLVIFTGRQTENELKERHPEEYQRLVQEGRLGRLAASEPQRWLKNFGRAIGAAVLAAGFILLWLTISAFLKG